METNPPIFEYSDIYALLQHINPWWQNKDINDKLPVMQRSAYNDVLQCITHDKLRRFAVLSGARRVGKTTVMRQLIAHLLKQGVPSRNILYVSFDNPVFKLCGIHNVLQAYRQIAFRGGECYYFFDEIQYAEDWSLWLKTLYDHYPETHVVATGSASPALEKGVSDSGVGRWRVYRMPTLTFREYCELQSVSPAIPQVPSLEEFAVLPVQEQNMLMLQLADLSPHWYHYLQQGGFPELLALEDLNEVQNIVQEDIVDKVLKRDIPALFDIRNPTQLEKIFLYLCLYSSNIFNLDTMSSALGVSKPTLSRYISYLQDANLIYIARNLCAGGKKGMSSQPKIYVADPTLRNACLLRFAPFVDDADLGMMAESTVFKHFYTAYSKYGEVGFMRSGSKGSNEIDIAVELRNGKRLFCEVKFRNDSEISAQSAIVRQCHESPQSLAFLATKRAQDFGVSLASASAPLYRIPAHALCYLLS